MYNKTAKISCEDDVCVTPIPGHATWRQMHRWPSRHYVYYTMPRLDFKEEKEGMANSWSELVNAQISPSQMDLLVFMCTSCFWKQYCVSTAHQSSISHYICTQKAFTFIPRSYKKRRYSTIADRDHSPPECNQDCISICYISLNWQEQVLYYGWLNHAVTVGAWATLLWLKGSWMCVHAC